MAHEAAHPAVAVGERVDKVQPVMGGSDGHDATGLAHRREAVAAFEMAHEGVDVLTRGRQMASNHNVMLRSRAPLARRDLNS